jgi:hypothetical protein
MTLFIFTEEKSLEICLNNLLPKIISNHFNKVKIRAHSGKEDLKKALKSTIPTISKVENVRILITIDQDKEDCRKLKEDIKKIIGENCRCEFKIRIICKELESWFFGDLEALATAYPRLKIEKYYNKTKFKNVDLIEKPSKELVKILEKIYNKKFSKTELCEKISPNLDLLRNTSDSFKQAIQAIKILTTEKNVN